LRSDFTLCYIPKVEEVQAFIEELDTQKIEAAAKDGVLIRQATVTKQMSAFIPLGWVCVEKSMPNHPLIYGARKSFMTTGQDSVRKYELLTKMNSASRRSVTRMEQILQLMTAACTS